MSEPEEAPPGLRIEWRVVFEISHRDQDDWSRNCVECSTLSCVKSELAYQRRGRTFLFRGTVVERRFITEWEAVPEDWFTEEKPEPRTDHAYLTHSTYTGPGCAKCGLAKELHTIAAPNTAAAQHRSRPHCSRPHCSRPH